MTDSIVDTRVAPAGPGDRRRVGLALVRPGEILGAEPFYHELIAGIERVLRPRGHTLLLQALADRDAELAAYRRWATSGDFGAVVLVDLTDDDPRPALLRALGLPAVVLGDPALSGDLPAVWTGDGVAMRDTVAALVADGHRRLAHVSGPAALLHTQVRQEALVAASRASSSVVETIEGDYSWDAGAAALSRLLSGPTPPTAVVFDNDQMALGGLAAAQRLGVGVPTQLTLVAWDDSSQCQLSTPSLSAVSHDVQRIGEVAAGMLLALLAGEGVASVEAPPASLVRRGSSGPAPG
jgi:LacI family repressor for deo operon, udp, cdd, tsx, nupC, and nupG